MPLPVAIGAGIARRGVTCKLPKMDIHKPKPVHNFREFLSEIIVVVVGIAIALSGEQLIEHLHDRHKAAEARQGIREEIAVNLAVLRTRSSIQECIDRRLDELGRMLDASELPDYVPAGWLGRPQIWEMSHARWQVIAQAGRTPLLGAEEQFGYGFIYALFADVAADQDREQEAWARLRALEGLAHPSATLRDTLRLALPDARYVNWDIKNLSEVLERRGGEMAVAKQPPPRLQGDTGICFASNTPRAEALNRLSAEAGHPNEEP